MAGVRRRSESMRIARALILSPLVPLLGVAVVGIGMGYRSVSGLGQFVFMWAIFLYPLVVALALGAYFVGSRLGLRSLSHFAFGGFFAGLVLTLGWIGPIHPAQGRSPLLPTIAFCAVAGAIGAGTAWVFWHLAVRERAD